MDCYYIHPHPQILIILPGQDIGYLFSKRSMRLFIFHLYRQISIAIWRWNSLIIRCFNTNDVHVVNFECIKIYCIAGKF